MTPDSPLASAGDHRRGDLKQAAVGKILEVVGEIELAFLEVGLRRVANLDVVRDAFLCRDLNARQLIAGQIKFITQLRDRCSGKRCGAAGQLDERPWPAGI